MQTNFRRYILNIDRISNDSSSAVTDSNMLDITNPSPQTFAKFQWTDSDSHFHLWAFDIRTIYIYIYVYEKKILTADVKMFHDQKFCVFIQSFYLTTFECFFFTSILIDQLGYNYDVFSLLLLFLVLFWNVH